MTNSVEEIFVNTFVQKGRRERALFELASKPKRGKFLNRLCHSYLDVFEARYLQPVAQQEDGTGLLKLLERLGAKQTCHVISCNDAVDGKQLLLPEAIAAVMGYGLPSVLVCVVNALAYFEAEQVSGPPPRYLLVAERGGT